MLDVIGIDEVGRGAWAGPLVFAAVIMSINFKSINKLNDSKKLSSLKRNDLAEEIKNKLVYSIVEISNSDIDCDGLTISSTKACTKLLEQINTNLNYKVILDGKVNYLKGTRFEKTVSAVIGADNTVPSVMAASIIAKVHRDKLMKQYSYIYSGYDFQNNFGYGTKNHISGIKKIGICSIHRRSYKPIISSISSLS